MFISFLETKVNGCNKRWYGKTKEHKALLEEGKRLSPWRDVKIRCHDFRVIFCTMCYDAEAPVKTPQVWMSHSDPTVLLKFYAKLTEAKEQYDVTKLNNIVQKRFAS